MPEIEMPPQYAGHYPDPHDNDGHVAEAVRTLAGIRLTQWLGFVQSAISNFESAANKHIGDLEYETDATFSFSPVLVSFAKAVVDAFPLTKVGEQTMSIVSAVMDGAQASYEKSLDSSLSGGKSRLRGSVTAFAIAARTSATKAVEELQKQLPEVVDEAMTWVDTASTDTTYVSALCDWMGFPQPTNENTVNPVRQSLENPFFGVYQAVRAQLKRTQGVPGLDDDDLSPTIWEREAVVSQRELYRQEGPAAWDKAYDPNTVWPALPR